MSAAKHTPGPWIAARQGGGKGFGGYSVRIPGDDTPTGAITVVHGRPHAYEEMKANAHLIAAAPDLLEALEEMLAAFPVSNPARDIASAAIAKARGDVR